ncbi:MAG: SprB repeat-containing protein [Bacteroidetes bacterium]|nr:SprB repeat-containing protein [Bacteroidota bacterium]MBS1930748.1 SprB repeat-containing protein [Bacteroidota bacterium]
MKAIFTKYQSWVFALLFALLLLVNKSFGQTATINLDYTGTTNLFGTCGGSDNTYANGNGSVSFSGGLPANAVITNINISANLGEFLNGSTTFSWTLNNTAIGSIAGVASTCQSGNFNASTVSPYNKTGTNTLAFSGSGTATRGVYNVTVTVTYIPCPTITASATKTNITCFNAGNGTITVSGSSGTAPYTFSINNGANYQAGNTFSNLLPGNYQIRVKDNNGCESKPVQ